MAAEGKTGKLPQPSVTVRKSAWRVRRQLREILNHPWWKAIARDRGIDALLTYHEIESSLILQFRGIPSWIPGSIAYRNNQPALRVARVLHPLLGRNNNRYQQRPHSTSGGVVVVDRCFKKQKEILYEAKDGYHSFLLIAATMKESNHVDESVRHLRESSFQMSLGW